MLWCSPASERVAGYCFVLGIVLKVGIRKGLNEMH